MENITYEEFINNILETRGRFACGEEYHERHHIIPKCCGGSDDKNNLIDLFAREHFIAHKLLAIENPNNERLVYAWWCMCNVKNKDQKRYEITEEEYEEVKISHQKMLSKKMSGNKNPMYGKHHTEDAKEKIREAAKNPSEETRKKKSEAHKGIIPSEETRKKMSITRSKRPSGASGKHWELSNETRNKMKDSAKKRYESEDERKKTSDSLKGKYTGENSNNAKAVVQLTKNDEFIAYFWGARQVEKELGICACNVARCCNNIKGFKSAGGFHWMYREEYEKLRN